MAPNRGNKNQAVDESMNGPCQAAAASHSWALGRVWSSAAIAPEKKNNYLIDRYPLVMTNSLLLKMAVEIVDLPIDNGDFP